MTDLTALTPIGTPVLSDLMYIVDDPAGTKDPRKITLQQIKDLFKAVVETLTGKTIVVEDNTLKQTVPATGDYLRDNGTKFLASAILVGDLPSGTGLTANPLSQFAATTSSQLAGVISDETGSGLLVFATAPVLVAPSISYTINAQTGTSYTLVLLDAGKIITSSNASAVTITIPPNSSVAYPIGSSITVISIGAGLTSFAQGAGVTITSTGAVPAAPVLRAQHSSATAIKTATDTWRVVGDIA